MTTWLLALTLNAFADAPEAVRLRQEIDRLAQREAWTGVERGYLALRATGAAPRPADLLVASAAARALGDVASARARALEAVASVEDRDAIEYLFRVDHELGQVTLRGAGPLTPELTPWLPDEQAAVAFAQAQLANEGSFTGYLPPGTYHFGVQRLEVVAGQRVEVVLPMERSPRTRPR
jgi:hypothetical protein